MANIKPIAFYLPQYHVIPENNEWWGEGFTEWTNTKKARPLFVGHGQPNEPHKSLGYYDLSNILSYKKQVELAKRYGLYGFCFYYYWFNGKKLLEKPLENVMRSSVGFPFCICWANENWTRRWDGQENEILMEQKHNLETDKKFFHDVLRILKDPRYIKKDNKPILIIYRTELFPNIKKTAKLWRKMAEENGLDGLHLVRVESFKDGIDPKSIGFDASLEFPPTGIWGSVGEPIQKQKALYGKVFPDPNVFNDLTSYPEIYDYDTVVHNIVNRKIPSYQMYRGAFPCWDNTPRKKERGVVFWNSSPLKFKYLLKKQIGCAIKSNQDFIFINAWNEWGEGCHLEPDNINNYGNLEALKSALRNQDLDKEDCVYLEKRMEFIKKSQEISNSLEADLVRQTDKLNRIIASRTWSLRNRVAKLLGKDVIN